ncbi:hypothetical protein TWF481_002542 [Arthrobotrys musiformis]|uniref:Glucose-methanol-choline oxidoreductase N-terminal domain-containing protein n=1 Tax=Arthrobotrys musiformis TaxID=47236 RepID=A0AAV9VUK6_9PEZI
MSIPKILPSEFAACPFDYIIVGGGTAGLVVASRLTEDPSIVVGVIEAGSPGLGDPLIDLPGRFGEAVHTKYDWEFETTVQEGLGNRKLEWARGKVLGGSSAINFFTWMRGNKQDYDSWEELGNKGWGWESMLPFFKKAETFIRPDLDQEKHKLDYRHESHGASGFIQTSYSKQHGAHHGHWHETLENLGVQRRSTFDGSNVGVWTGLTSVNSDTKRSYAANEYYLPYALRDNLKVICDSIVREVILEPVDGQMTATGVRFASAGFEYTASARKEVVVSCGSVQSPLILELSGIGNPDILKAAGIDVKIENKNVGENLQDRLMVAMVYEIDTSTPNADDLRSNQALAAAADEEYEKHRTGLRTILPCSFTYLPLSQFMKEDRISQLAIQARDSWGTEANTLQNQDLLKKLTSKEPLGQMEFVFDARNWYPVFALDDGKKYGTMLQMLQYPFSTGSLHIPPKPPGKPRTTSDDKPVIDPKYYQGVGALDQVVMAEGLKFGHKITKTPPLCQFVKRRVFPPPPSHSDGDEDFFDYVKHHTISDWHPTGTCAMGGSNGIKNGVVDERLKVYGTTNLRCIDASIMPVQISCHPQATVYAIAEKGASMVLEDLRTQ